MCGYCTENIYFSICLQDPTTFQELLTQWPCIGIIDAQETSDPLGLLQTIAKTPFLPDVLRSLHCRALDEALRTDPSDPARTQVLAALSKFEKEYREALSQWLPSGTTDPLLPIPAWADLYDPGLLLEPGRWARFMDDPHHEPAADSVLKTYRKWWIDGEGLVFRGQDELFLTTGGIETTGYVEESQWQRLAAFLPCVSFALSLAGSKSKDLTLVKTIALTDPMGVPDPPGPTLSLQRKAMLLMIERTGVPFLLEHISPEIRPQLGYHAFLRIGAVRQERARLMERMAQVYMPPAKSCDFFEACAVYLESMAAMPG